MDGPAVFTEIADGRWRAGDPADALTTRHPPDLTLVKDGSAWHYYSGGECEVQELVVVVEDERLVIALAWEIRPPRGVLELLEKEPLPLFIVDEPTVLGAPAIVRLNHYRSLLAVVGAGGAVTPP